ncbi:MAG: insulinase family protein [Flavobacteriia bacterium]|nr:insulinase family protein [Flavobacteriia bacterium]OIP45494.1 MAG: peptidase M16 [Flavobacteriaceae bacterium CG2_30_31_66]PIV96748.1 MAG: peptidase M16 [Flavobacteriaceae bacterium CG17_big_fil_post_rev_8_21_14_2_50_31_13]PIX11252.1 MAG: peptidase M16 [Flavobacteriaceae bacterium CG_4_8_14_3_um_filter_31_8]PIY14922.1 MAG: peptidase M16 [Flavobacteriaceae bacterium CG_4_10_14_3_um_filter_31_253]PIZ11614.1 MAG: peptidase M16 [Flavobacteriaceae bacterium CG_4_10_14_0_8_um_filter_31_99]PJC11
MKTRIITLVTFLLLSFAGNAQIDRSKQPEPGPSPKIKLGKAETFTLKNGLKVIMVENHKLPRVSANLTIDNDPYFEGEKAGLSSMMGSLLGRGTKNITKDAFNEKVDYYGANVSFFSSGAFASSLKRYFPEILGLMADGVKNSTFTQEEFEKQQKIILDNLKNNEKNVTSIARRVENVLTYGKDHPYGEFTSKESVNKITLQDVVKNYNDFYKPNNAYLVIVGDFEAKEIKKLVNTLFSNWQSGIIPAYTLPTPKNVPTTEINFIDMPNAVQSEIAVINTINLKLGDNDYFAALLANQILGGGGTARLFQNLREDKGYTYGAYSSVRQSKYAGTFRASTSVRNIVTDSSVVELMKEINTIRYKKVSEEDLKNVKEEYIGGFVMDVQKPATVAGFALNMARYNLPKDFYETYLEKINAVTLDDIQNAAIKYFQGDKARIIITGKGIDVLKNLENTDYVIKYFDKEGNPTEKPAMTLPIPDGMTAEKVVNNYLNAIGGKDKVMAVKTTMMTANATIQGTPLVMTMKASLPNKTSQVISVMGNVAQKSVFDGEKGYEEGRGQKIEMTAEQITEAKAANSIFSDLNYTKGTLVRIEPLDGKNAIVLKFNDTEVFYDMTSWLKVKEVKKVKTPDGQEVEVPTNFGDYKEVKGIKFPFSIGQKMGPMDLNFEIKEIKINEGVSDADFK